ncbi:MAG: amino acid permease, partial [Bryobacteraceae bacterium]
MASAGQLVKGLGLLDGTMLVMGSMIGSGIFIVSADIARQVASPGLLIVVWLLATVLTMVAALCYGELAAMMPHAGGQYVYLREAFGPLVGFLFGWTSFLVIQTGTIAAVGVAFAKFTGVFVPWISADRRLLPGVSTQQALAIAVLVFLTWLNTRGIRTGAIVQNVFTFAKTAALLGLVVAGLGVGFFVGHGGRDVARNFSEFWRGADWSLDAARLVGVAMVGALFSADAWNNVTFTAGEMR